MRITEPIVINTGAKFFEVQTISPFLVESCSDLLANGSRNYGKVWQDIVDTITAANREFLRRGWSPAFLAERIRLAKDYFSQSEYKRLLLKDRGIVATLGWTFAEYTADTLPDPNRLAIESREKSQILPEEDSLKIKPLQRPLGHDGRGIIFELRTWSISKHLLDQNERAAAFAETISSSFPSIARKLKDYPEFYDLPILHLYADEASLKLYGRLGFSPTHERPIHHEGANWWDMTISPRDYEKLVYRMKDPLFVSGFNQNLDMNFLGLNLQLVRGGMFRKRAEDDLSDITFISGVRTTEIARGVFAANGAQVTWFANNRLAKVSELEKPFKFTSATGLTIVADKGSKIVWNKAGQVIEVSKLANDTKVGEPNLYAAKGTGVLWRQDGIQLRAIDALAGDTMVADGIEAAKGSTVEWWAPKGYPPSHVSALAKRTRLEDGTVAEKGARVLWTIPAKRGEDGLLKYSGWRWCYLSRLAVSAEVFPGLVAPAGASIDFPLDAETMEIDFAQPPKVEYN